MVQRRLLCCRSDFCSVFCARWVRRTTTSHQAAPVLLLLGNRFLSALSSPLQPLLMPGPRFMALIAPTPSPVGGVKIVDLQGGSDATYVAQHTQTRAKRQTNQTTEEK